jgi:cysteine desulfurase / selenocysteine lyase
MAVEPFSEQDIQKFRAETRGAAEMIHFNNAGSSLPPDVVVKEVINYLKEEAAIGGYEAEYKYREPLENVYGLIAELIHAGKDEVALAENASMGWSVAFNGIDFRKGDVILTSEMEYVTNVIGFLNAKKMYGVEIRVVPNDEGGNFSLPALEAAISPQTKLIAMTHIPSTAGGMIPIVEIGKIARKNNILYLVDACQSIGQAPVDVKAIDCDLLSVTGRKYLRAPRGTGFLYVRKSIQDRLKTFFADGHSTQWVSEDDYMLREDARRFQLYERNRGLTLGLGKAIEYVLKIGVDRVWFRVQELGAILRTQLQSIGCITVHDQGDLRSGIVTFSVDGTDAAMVKARLGENHINVSVGVAVSTLIYMNKNHLVSVVRASVHYYNTEEEIGKMCEVLASMG